MALDPDVSGKDRALGMIEVAHVGLQDLNIRVVESYGGACWQESKVACSAHTDNLLFVSSSVDLLLPWRAHSVRAQGVNIRIYGHFSQLL
jgi:hypothetical protein